MPRSFDTIPAAGAPGRRASTESPGLMVRVRLAQGLIQNLPAHVPLFGLERLPEPAAIGNRRGGEIHQARRAAPTSRPGLPPTSPRPGLIASPLKRWKVSIPMPGFTNTASISLGRMTLVSVCAHALTAQASKRKATRICLDDMVGLRLLRAFSGPSLAPEICQSRANMECGSLLPLSGAEACFRPKAFLHFQT